MTMIDQRPIEAADRGVFGHWKGDLITGASNRSAIGTLVERASRFTILLYLPAIRWGAVRDAVIDALSGLPAHLRRSVTWDQGSEMALHCRHHDRLGHAGVLRPEGQPVAAAQQREHQRAAAPVLPEGN
jgi:IS30 family transposase